MRTFILACMIFISGIVSGQQNGLNKIKEYDLSNIWTSGGTTDIDETDFFTTERPDFRGFIGDNYQRIYIQIDEVVKDHLNPLIYYVRGYSEVKGNRCSFLGKIKIDSAQITERGQIFEGADYLVDMNKVTHRGTVVCSYQFFENRNQKWTGFFSGQLRTQFYLTTDGQIKYDAIGGFSDSYMNNAYIGAWTSYSSGNSKTCNWGEFRIPESGDLDIGSGDFSPTPKYIENGWEEN
ncbi:hypothetical protein [Marinoscillum furvescens]|uniref:Uncharacterized protein n=1 Tax=Marinoscillum furvescens DSM 4134 TaxID=1122208 RepID=A0A3D9KX04_MARFU|nr:hypothetical protein [Marinoscillum furvescens]RED93170.1 hypothetical protein C7460_1269 [Marinoscillum furvescens DSM 4134]